MFPKFLRLNNSIKSVCLFLTLFFLNTGLAQNSATCSGITTTWNGVSWYRGVPGPNDKAILKDSYNTETNGNIDACSLEIRNHVILTIADNTYVYELIQSHLHLMVIVLI